MNTDPKSPWRSEGFLGGALTVVAGLVLVFRDRLGLTAEEVDGLVYLLPLLGALATHGRMTARQPLRPLVSRRRRPKPPIGPVAPVELDAAGEE